MDKQKKKTDWTTERLDGFKRGKSTPRKEQVIKKVEEKLKVQPKKK